MIERVDEFKNRFSAALDLRDVKPVEIALRTGLSESIISQYRSGKAKPNNDRLVLLANVLNVNPMWLMGLDVPRDAREQMELAKSPIDHLAILINEQIKDRALSKALRYYFTFTDEQKKVIIQMIHAIHEANELTQSSSADSKAASSNAKSKKE